MNKNLNAYEILEIFENSSYEEIFKALILFEDKNISEEKINKLYYDFMQNDDITGFIDIEKNTIIL